MKPVTLEYRPPSSPLCPYTSLFYDFRTDLPFIDDHERADLAQLRFVLRTPRPGDYTFADGTRSEAPLIQLLGPTTGPVRTRGFGPIHVFGCGLLPRGWAALLKFEASLLVNRVIDATSLFGEEIVDLRQELVSASGIDERVTLLSAWLSAVFEREETHATQFTRQVDAWLETVDPSLDALIAATGMSARQLERNCNRYYGAPPKLLARKYRALRAAVMLARDHVDITDLIALGFYDQSHLIREIKQFTGFTPGKLAVELTPLTSLTLRRGEFDQLSPLVTQT